METLSATILIVDDDPAMLFTLARMVSQSGYNVLEATTGQQCLTLTAEKQPDLILLNVHLPDIDGLEICRQIKNDPALANACIFFLSTGQISSKDQADGLEAGAEGYLTHPIAKPDLLAQIRTTLRLKAAEKALQQTQAELEKRVHERTIALETTNAALQQSEKRARLLENIAVASNKAENIEQALQVTLNDIAQYAQWPVGHVYVPDTNNTVDLVSANIWYLADAEKFRPFVEIIQKIRFGPGMGLPGQVLNTKQPAWVADVTQADAPLWASPAKDAGLRGMLAFPIIAYNSVAAVLEFYSTRPVQPNTTRLQLLAQIGLHLGIVIERKQAEVQLRRAKETAEGANRAKSEFLAMVSHELRTPLNAILGMAEVLAEKVHGPINTEQATSIQYITEGGNHLLELINDILDVSKIEVGELELQLQTINTEDVCQASLRFVRSMAQTKQLKLLSVLDYNATVLQADKRRLKQILVNLLTNAVKFTPEGGQVKLEMMGDKENKVIRFVISDTGIGIAQEELARIFAPFSQGDSALSYTQEGTGLGLALVAHLTEMHGGSVTVESHVNQGSSFTIALPWDSDLKLEATETPASTSLPLPQTPPVDSPPPNPEFQPSILLVEDSEANIAMMLDLLQIKYQVIVAKNGVEAIEQAQSTPPDLILMDIQMPVMDGLEAIRRLRADEQFATVPIIALTALAMPGDRERCLDAGADEYLSKPVSMKGLLKVIEAHLKGNK